jgi:hypothetical protein
MFEGHVLGVEENVIRLSTGTWRYHDESLAFTSLLEAICFIEAHPMARPAEPVRLVSRSTLDAASVEPPAARSLSRRRSG